MDREVIEATITMVREGSESLNKKHLDIMKALDEREATELEFLRSIVAQIPSEASGPLMPKTPKVAKRGLQRIKTIPEDDVMNDSDAVEKVDVSEEEVKPTRARRAASQKATESIKKQQSLTLTSKMRRPSNDVDVITETIKNQELRRSKRPKNSLSNSSDDDRPPTKYAKTSKLESKRVRTKKIKEEPPSPKDPTPPPPTPPRQTRSSSTHPPRPPQIIDETLELPNETLTDPSMYEDAIGKSIPMNSTMNPNTTITIDRKMMNATVVLEKINETITLQKSSFPSGQNSLANSQKNSLKFPSMTPVPESASKRTLQTKLQALKESLANQEFEALLTDDESSPERKILSKKPKKLPEKFKKPRKPSSSDEDPKTPIKKPLKDLKYKTNALFSPYAKESVKKKVEAFEQAVQQSPKSPQVDAPTRITRTKTRAMAAAEETPKPQTLAQKLARKSLAKAKRISLNRLKREEELKEGKENLLSSATKMKYFPLANDKLLMKQNSRMTPVSKSRLQMPMSVNRIQGTPASYIPPAKSVTASKAVHASTESLNKPLSKSGSTDSLAEKKKLDEDARRKKEENLKVISEEKKRKREEKELKNKMAREAREKLEQQRRLQLEKEREDKARQALIAQEKLKEEIERKKMLQLQRAQEKEERRRQEELMRIQKIQEQEEAERSLAEQKRKEQEAEKRRIQEAKAQQYAALESLKLKATMMAKAKQRVEKAQGPQAYVLDSDPDDEESDDESRPKHPIPHWARADVRKGQLEMQQYVPMVAVLKFFGAKKCTPNLGELFVGIRNERMKRTSSANWKTPPRFSMMEAIED